jgi:hypothetical protein
MKLDILQDSVSSVSAMQTTLNKIADELKNIEIDKKPMSALEASELIADHLKELTGDLGIFKKQVSAIQQSLRLKIRAEARQEQDEHD